MRYLSLCGLAAIAVASPARGQHNWPTEIAFMECTLKNQGKLKGESTEGKHKDAFELRDFAASADGKSFTIATGVDALPQFLMALSTKEVITHCRIEIEKRDPNPNPPPHSPPWVVAEIVTLANARFSDVTLLVDPPKEAMVQLTLTTAGGKVDHVDNHGVPISAFPTIDDEKVGSTRIDADFTVNGAHVQAGKTKSGGDFKLKSILWTAESPAGAFDIGPLLFSMTENASADAVTGVAKTGAQLKGTKLTIFHQPIAKALDEAFISIELVDAAVTSENQTAPTAHSASGNSARSDDFTVKVLHVRVNNLVRKTEFVQ